MKFLESSEGRLSVVPSWRSEKSRHRTYIKDAFGSGSRTAVVGEGADRPFLPFLHCRFFIDQLHVVDFAGRIIENHDQVLVLIQPS